jgi:CubicO group peptidase (beta-lactamase class C family)
MDLDNDPRVNAHSPDFPYQATTLSRRRLLRTTLALLAAAPLTPTRGTAQTPVASPVGAALPTTLAPDASPRFRAVADAFMAALAASGAPGGALGILADGAEEHAAFGVTDIASQTPVGADTLFQIGSVTKTMAGTALMRLVEDGALELDAPVRTWLPDLELPDEAVAAAVTPRHLLTHSGGWWGDLFADTGDGDDAIARFIARWFPTFPQLAPLGGYVSYNNAGFVLAGRLVEVVTGRSYERAIRELVLDPIGLDESFMRPTEARPHALGHFVVDGPPLIQEPLFLPRALDPAGGVWSTTRDLLRYARFHLGDGTAGETRLLPAATLAAMQEPRLPVPGIPGLSMGLPWFVAEPPGLRLVFHNGATFGQSADLFLVPERGFALAAFTNALPAGSAAVQAALVAAIAHYLAPAEPEPATPVGGTPLTAAPGTTPDLDDYAGSYEDPNGTAILRREGDVLLLTLEAHFRPEHVVPRYTADLPTAVPLQFVAEDLAVIEFAGQPLPLAFVRRPDGSVGWLASSLRLVPKVA